MRGYFDNLAEPPMMLMDGDGDSGGGSDRDRDIEEAAQRGEISARGFDPASGDIGDPIGRDAPGRNPDRVAPAPDRTGFGAFGDRSPAPGSVSASGTGAPEARGGPGNQLRAQSARAPDEATAAPERAERVREELRRAVVTLGIPGTLARANTLF